jgi:hypothetical protein
MFTQWWLFSLFFCVVTSCGTSTLKMEKACLQKKEHWSPAWAMHKLRNWCPTLSAHILPLAISYYQDWLPLHPCYYSLYCQKCLEPNSFWCRVYKDIKQLVEDFLHVRFNCTSLVDLVTFRLGVIHVWFTSVTCCWNVGSCVGLSFHIWPDSLP